MFIFFDLILTKIIVFKLMKKFLLLNLKMFKKLHFFPRALLGDMQTKCLKAIAHST